MRGASAIWWIGRCSKLLDLQLHLKVRTCLNSRFLGSSAAACSWTC
jgi:hypothetical protein